MNFRRLGLSALALSLTIATGCTPNLATPPVTASGASAAAAQSGPAGIPVTGPANGPVPDVPMPPASGVVTPPTGTTQASEGLAGTISGIPNVAGLEVAVYDQAGQELAPRVKTDEKGNYAFARVAATGGWVLVKAFIPTDRALMALDAGGRSLTAIVPAPGKGARAEARLDAASTLVAKKFVALVNRGQLKATDVDPAVVEKAAAALRPVLKADDVERALRGDAQVAAVLFDLLLSRNPQVRAAVTAATGAATLPRSTSGGSGGGSNQGTTTTPGVFRVAGSLTSDTLGKDVDSLTAVVVRGDYTYVAVGTKVLRVHHDSGAQTLLQPPGITNVIKCMAFDETGALWVGGSSADTVVAKYLAGTDSVVGSDDAPIALRTGGVEVRGLAFGDDGALFVVHPSALVRVPDASTVNTEDAYSSAALAITGLSDAAGGSAGEIGGTHHFVAFVPDAADDTAKRDMLLGVEGYIFRIDADEDGVVDGDSMRTLVAGNGSQSTFSAATPPNMGEMPISSESFLLAGDDGDVYFSVSANQVVYRIETGDNGLDVADVPTLYAGTHRVAGYSGDGEAPAAARLYRPGGLAFHPDGSLLIAHQDYSGGPETAVRAVSDDGMTISTATGVPTEGDAKDIPFFSSKTFGMAAARGKVYWNVRLASPSDYVFLYELDTATGVQKVIAQYKGDGDRPIAVSSSGTIVVATDTNLSVVAPDTGNLTELVPDFGDCSGGIAFDPSGNLYFASTDTIYKATLTTNGLATIGDPWIVGQNASEIRSLTISPKTGEIWAADAGNGELIRLLPSDVPASGAPAVELGTKAVLGSMGYLLGLDFDAAGTLYVATATSGFPAALVGFDTTGKDSEEVVMTVQPPVGDGSYTLAHFAGSGVDASPDEAVTDRTTARLGELRMFKVDRSTGALYAVDEENDRLLRIK